MTRRKSLQDFRSDLARTPPGQDLKRDLGTFSLTCFGVGGTIGAGVFVLTGTVAALHTGPAVALAYVLASLVCAIAGLCYAEMASMMPVAGSAYSYTYAAFGKLPAWLVGWCLSLEYLLSVSIVAVGWSGYAQSAAKNLGIVVPLTFAASPFISREELGLGLSGSFIDAPAVLICLVCTAVVLSGTRAAATLNSGIVLLKVLAILAVVALAWGAIDTTHWRPFLPPNTGRFGSFGWSGVFRGAAILFFAYTGFDAVSTLSQDVRNPQRAIPLSLFASLTICAALYVLVGLLVTGLVDYHLLNVPDPVDLALQRAGYSVLWAKLLVAALTVIGLISVMIANLIGQVRILYAMSRDGLLPAAFATVDGHSATPRVGTLVTGVAAALVAGFLPLGLLGELASIGTLLAFACVCASVLVLRKTNPREPRRFKVPFSPWIPLLGVASCSALMLSLPLATWVRLMAWLTIGYVIYALHGARRTASPANGQASHEP